MDILSEFKKVKQPLENDNVNDSNVDLVLKLVIYKARNLSKENELNLNPYVSVELGSNTQTTHTVKKESSPEWNCSFDFNISKDILGHKKRVHALTSQGLSITVFSKDRFSSVFLGQTIWSVDQLFQPNQPLAFEENQAQWYSLSLSSPRHKRFHLLRKHKATDEPTLGEIFVQYGLALIDKQGEAISSSSIDLAEKWQSILIQHEQAIENGGNGKNNASAGNTATEPVSEPLVDEITKVNEKADTKPKSDFTGVMFLEIESAKDLPPEKTITRIGFDMDPFVIVSYGISTFRTSVVRHSLNPVWNEKLFFHVKNTQEKYRLRFTVYDKDKLSGNDFTASNEISLFELIQQGSDHTFSTSHLQNEIVNKSNSPAELIESQMGQYTIPLNVAQSGKWKETSNPTLTFRAKFVPYTEIRKMFWVALAKTCDADSSETMSYIEVQTMLETLGSTLSKATLVNFWTNHGKEIEEGLSMDELVDSLELFIETSRKTHVSHERKAESDSGSSSDEESSSSESTKDNGYNNADLEILAEGEGVQYVQKDLESLKLQEETEVDGARSLEEKLIQLSECPLCRKPILRKSGQMDIITHVAICAAHDWTTVDRFLMSNSGSESYAQAKWFVKLVKKVGYGKYSIGKNNANIIVQDRATGQLIDERMSPYVRLGMRLLYTRMKSGIQSKKAQRILASMSVRQGRRYNNPLSVSEIGPFIQFHKLDMSEVLEPIENFKTFNEFFYRKLKPGSRPCDSPDKKVVVSPADCRMMAFQTIDSATQIWIKGVDFSLSKLLDDPEEAKAFEGGSLAIFRLAPQDYHRYHSPVDGLITKIHHVSGQYYTVNPMAIRTTLDVYGDNKRDIVHLQTEEFGKVAIVCVGAMMVGSIVLTAKEGDYLARTDELGYFAFGGSTLVVLFEKDTITFDQDLLENAENSLETLVAVGNHIATHN